MALLRGKKRLNQSDLPPEVQDYYRSERKQSRLTAFILALTTVALTILLALGLYHGGRWVYNKFFDDRSAPTINLPDRDNRNDSSEKQRPADGDKKTTQDSNNSNDSSNPNDERDQDARPDTLPGDSDTNTGGDSSSDNNDNEEIPTTGPQEDLPSTGPESNLTIFLSVALLGFLVHKFVIARR